MPPDDPKVDPPKTPDPAAELAAAKARIVELEAAAAKGKKTEDEDETDDQDLRARARKDRESSDTESGRTKKLEDAIKFNLGSKEFLKTNEALLPKEVADIFARADRENFSDAIQKDSAIKSGLVEAFFSVQSNVDILTSGQKSALDEYLKLTKDKKQEKAQSLYEMVFEPAFEALKRSKKAEALQRGHGTGEDDAYKQKLMKLGARKFLGEKNA